VPGELGDLVASLHWNLGRKEVLSRDPPRAGEQLLERRDETLHLARAQRQASTAVMAAIQRKAPPVERVGASAYDSDCVAITVQLDPACAGSSDRRKAVIDSRPLHRASGRPGRCWTRHVAAAVRARPGHTATASSDDPRGGHHAKFGLHRVATRVAAR